MSFSYLKPTLQLFRVERSNFDDFQANSSIQFIKAKVWGKQFFRPTLSKKPNFNSAPFSSAEYKRPCGGGEKSLENFWKTLEPPPPRFSVDPFSQQQTRYHLGEILVIRNLANLEDLTRIHNFLFFSFLCGLWGGGEWNVSPRILTKAFSRDLVTKPFVHEAPDTRSRSIYDVYPPAFKRRGIP